MVTVTSYCDGEFSSVTIERSSVPAFIRLLRAIGSIVTRVQEVAA